MALIKVVRGNEASSDVYGENQVTKWDLKNYAQKKLQKKDISLNYCNAERTMRQR